MSGINDGGPAFPTRGEDFIEGPQGRGPQSAWGMEPKQGMSLRDWFAGQAMAGMLANGAIIDTHNANEQMWIALHAYAQADAMIAARNKQEAK